MKKRSIIILLAIVFMIQFVSAGIYFSGLQAKYNLGDMINLNVQAEPIIEGRLLKVDLLCNNVPIIYFNNLPDESGYVNIKLPLNIHTINQANGNCYFLGDYSGESRKSNEFEISKKLIVKLSSDTFFSDPGKEIIISGSSEKLNGNIVEGEVEITIPLLNLATNENIIEENLENNESSQNESEETIENTTVDINQNTGIYYGRVLGGDFSVGILLPENIPAGDYRVDVLVYEESDGLRTSEGVAFANLKVFQILKEIEVALNNQNFDPGTNLEIKPSLLDQSGANVDDEVSIIIRNSDALRIFEKISNSQETINYLIPSNMSSGYYEIEAVSGDFKNIKSFFINQKAIATFNLVNNTLIITNIGNIPYNKGVEIELNGKTFVKVVELDLGESTKFKLTGTEDEYNIRVSDGNSEISQSGVKLTGRSVNVDAINEKGFVSSPIAWIFIIVVLGIGLLFLFRNILKRKSFAFHLGKDITVEKPKTEIYHQADQVVVLKGHKSNAVVLALKIKNVIGKFEKQSLENAISHVYAKRGAVYEQGDFIFVIFSPLMTNTNKNEVEATKSAQKISNILNEHNKKFKEKIEYGIGINSGEIINKIEDKKLKFTALGNFIISAKRLAGISNKQVLVTKNSYEKGISEIKAEKRKHHNGEYYEVRMVVDTEKNQKFIKSFLDRQGKEITDKDNQNLPSK